MEPLAGKVAIVTGAGRGLGRSMALGLARAGAAVVAVAARERGVAETIDLLLAIRFRLVGPGVGDIATRLFRGVAAVNERGRCARHRAGLRRTSARCGRDRHRQRPDS